MASDSSLRVWNWKMLKYLLAFTIPGVVLFSLQSEGWWTFFALGYAFVLLPGLELILPQGKKNLSAAEREVASKDPYYDLILWSMVIIQWGLLLYFILQMGQNTRPVGSLDWWGLVLSMGLSCSILGINVGHELGHRTDRFSQSLAKSLLITSLYSHFYIEHNKGHHRNVATPDDPATARKNEWFQLFWFRAVFMAWWSGWQIEAQSLRRKNKSVWHPSNEFLQLQIIQWALLAAVGLLWGWQTALSWFVAGMFGGFLLEVVNYVEHYGLQRERVNEHRYERVMPHHSWNSDHPLGRMMLFELTRHSDHHHQPAKPFQLLDTIEDAPQLPTGYPGMMVLSLIPPLYFAIMNPRLERLRKQQ